MEQNNERKLTMYSKDHLNEFRKSIQNMGTMVGNGTVEIPLDATSTTKGRRMLDRLKPDDVLKTPMSDIKSWRKYSRIYFANPLYRRILEYFAYTYYNNYIVSPIFDEGKKPNKKKMMKSGFL